MAGEPILIVDDTPVNLKLTRILLLSEGFQVATAPSAEEALDLLREFRPRLILADIQLPGIDGLEMTRRIKQDPATRDIAVVALTAFAMKGDEQKALDAGCDGYITKPIDTRTLGAQLRELLAARAGVAWPESMDSGTKQDPLPSSEMSALRRRFLQEGQERSRQILADLDGDFQATATARIVHSWVGTGGLLGFMSISRLAREVETQLHERPVDAAQVRESMMTLALAFTTPLEARERPVPSAIVTALAGKRVALLGLPASESQRICIALERVDARPEFVDAGVTPSACDLHVVHVGADGPVAHRDGRPIVFAGESDHVSDVERGAQVLIGAWQPDEALLRMALAMSRPEASPQRDGSRAPSGRAVRIEVSDEAVAAAVRDVLEEAGVAVEDRAPAAVVDSDQAVPDGGRVLLLAPSQSEDAILRAFESGAADFLLQPFSPLELAARIERLLSE